MIVRGLDGTHDWTFGKGLNDYKRLQDAVAQNIDTKLLMFFGDCFFAGNQGIDWFNLLGTKNQLGISLAVKSTILNCYGVVSLNQVSLALTPSDRDLKITYNVTTIFSKSFTAVTTIGGTTSA